MQKFKALFKRGQRTIHGRHVETQPSTAGDPSAAPFPDFQSASIAVAAAGKACIDERIDVFANGKTNGVIMEDEIEKLKNEMKKREELLAKLAAENNHLKLLVKRLPEINDEQSSDNQPSDGGSAFEGFSSIDYEQIFTSTRRPSQDQSALLTTPPDVSTIRIPENSSGTSRNKIASPRDKINDEQSSYNQPSDGGSAFEGFPSIDYEQIFTSTPRPSQDRSALLTTPPDVSTIRIPENSSGTSRNKSASPCDKSSRLLQPSSTGDLDVSPIFKDERLKQWLKELYTSIPESLRNLSTEQSSSQTTLVNENSSLLQPSSTGDLVDIPIFKDERLNKWLKEGRITIPESLRNLSTEQSSSQTTHVSETQEISSSIVGDSNQENTSSILQEKNIPCTSKDKPAETDVIVIESSSSEDDLISQQKEVNEEITSEPKYLREIAALAVLPLLPLPKEKKTLEFTSTIVLDSTIDLESTVAPNSTLLPQNLSLNETAIYCGVKPQELSAASITEELQEVLIKPEIEVSQLQDHLRQMEESHYSTSEELQATIQELSDLQTQLDQTRNEKEKFREEKTLLLESLYRQTERLQSAKKENENLQKLLHESASDNSVPDREKKLIELLKQGQAKRETMISHMNELEYRLNEVQRAKELAEEENRCLADRVGELKVTLEDVQDEKRTLEDELVNLKEEQSSKYFEILRLNVLLDIEETKVKELKAAQASLGNENELYNMMNNVLKEKELVEKKMAESEDILKRTNCENKRLSQEINALREQLTVLKESAANAISDLENHSKLRKIEQEEAAKKIEMTENTLKDMKQQYDVLSRDLKVVTENLKITEDKLQITVTQFEDLKEQKLKEKQRRDDECAEWKQLHEDLLVAVRVANDIKTECQQQLERTQARIRELEETNATLIAQNEQYIRKEKMTLKPLDILKSPNVPKVLTSSSASATHTTVAAATKETAIHKFSKPSLQCVNVKSLIESIENANKQTKTGQPDSCSGSKAGSPQRETNPPLPLREQPLTSNKQTQQTAPPVISVLATPTDEKKDPLHSLVERNGGSKRNALLKWVQNRIQGYPNIEITNFSSSWTDGLALCALLHTYIPHKIPYNLLSLHNKQHNFGVAFSAAESEGIPTILNMNDMTQQERPDWQKVMAYVKEIYTHFEGRDTI